MNRVLFRGWRIVRPILTLVIFFAVFAAIGSTTLVSAGEDNLKIRLSDYGLAEVGISISGDEATVAYAQPVSEVNDISGQLTRIATILSYVTEELPGVALVRVEQHFDDGQIMEISGKPADGVDFLNGQLSEDDFMDSLEFTPLTRGPLIIPGECEPGRGENCENCPECGCYPNERCDPANPQANQRGCVEVSAPANAHLEGSEYVCDEGYEWNSDLTGCVPKLECPPNAFKFQGECHCEPGYEWNAEGTECVPVGDAEPESDTDSGFGDDIQNTTKGFLDSFLDWVSSFTGCSR